MSTTEKSNLEAVVEALLKKEKLDPAVEKSIHEESRRYGPSSIRKFRWKLFGRSAKAMSEYVLDSSVALKWILAEPHRTAALQLRDDFRSGIHRLIARTSSRLKSGTYSQSCIDAQAHAEGKPKTHWRRFSRRARTARVATSFSPRF